LTPKHVADLSGLLTNSGTILTSLEGNSEHITSNLLPNRLSEGTPGQKVTTDELDGFNIDWMGKYRGHSKVIIKPKSTQEVSAIVKYCYDNNIAVVPQGGNTGLVGVSL